ncbi:MAG: hypothetical protein ACQEQC_01115 [Elusimicrobiota bacterium]
MKNSEKILPGKFIYSGVALLIIGFTVLYFVNRKADNWAAFLGPVFLIASWLTIGIGLWQLDEKR